MSLPAYVHFGTIEVKMNELTKKVIEYYNKRGLKWPNTYQALAWAITELGEAYELLLARDGDWVRNNPDPEDKFSRIQDTFMEELGDTIMVLVVAGLVSDTGLGTGRNDPLSALEHKIARKLEEAEGR